MPELPEVETIRRDLTEHILNRKINEVQVLAQESIRGSYTGFQRVLKNNRFIKIDRVGKLLIFVLPKKTYLLTHLKMTGQFILVQKTKRLSGGHPFTNIEAPLPNKFTRVIFNFANGAKLYFNDLRRFGYMQIVNEAGLEKTRSRFGLEPLSTEFSLVHFANLLKNKKTKLKALLLDQTLIAGLGNIYADEACFLAGVLPGRASGSLKASEIKKLQAACIKVLKLGIKNRGTSFSNYIDLKGQKGKHYEFLNVYGRKNKNCKRCKKHTIKKIRLVGRGTHFCPACQK